MVSFDEEQVNAGRYGPSVELAWEAVSSRYEEAVKPPVSWCRAEVEHELLFCLMGGFGVSYEHGRTASEIVWQLEPFSEKLEDCELFDMLSNSLMLPQFGPPKADGTLRRYRYPFQKASTIVKVRNWLRFNKPLHERLLEFGSCQERRALLIGCPGIGMKTASWLLRNLGLGRELAIIDIHVYRALVETERIPIGTRLPRDYGIAERAFLEWCQELGAPPDAFDLFIWHRQRGS